VTWMNYRESRKFISTTFQKMRWTYRFYDTNNSHYEEIRNLVEISEHWETSVKWVFYLLVIPCHSFYCCLFVLAVRHVDLSSTIEDRTQNPCIERWSLTTGPPSKRSLEHKLVGRMRVGEGGVRTVLPTSSWNRHVWEDPQFACLGLCDLGWGIVYG